MFFHCRAAASLSPDPAVVQTGAEAIKRNQGELERWYIPRSFPEGRNVMMK